MGWLVVSPEHLFDQLIRPLGVLQNNAKKPSPCDEVFIQVEPRFLDQSGWMVQRITYASHQLPPTSYSCNQRRMARLAWFYFYAPPEFDLPPVDSPSVAHTPFDSGASMGGDTNALGTMVFEIIGDARNKPPEYRTDHLRELLSDPHCRGIRSDRELSALLSGWTVLCLDHLHEHGPMDETSQELMFNLIHAETVWGKAATEETAISTQARENVLAKMCRKVELLHEDVPPIELAWRLNCVAAEAGILAKRYEACLLDQLGKPATNRAGADLECDENGWCSWDRSAFAFWKHQVGGAPSRSLNRLWGFTHNDRATDAIKSVRNLLHMMSLGFDEGAHICEDFFSPYELAKHRSS